MIRNRLVLALVCACSLVSLSGCMASTIATTHEYVLVRTQGNELVTVEEDDPLYDDFDTRVFADAYLHRLLMVFEHTTESFLATNTFTPLDNTIANRLVIVADSQETRVLRTIKVHDNGSQVLIELAIGLGHNGHVDLAWAQRNFPRVMATFLLELVGLKRDQTPSPQVYELTNPSEAFWVGFQAALECIYGQQHKELLTELQAQEPQSREAADRLRRYEMVPQNGLRFLFKDNEPTSKIRSPEQAFHTPGVVATFLYRLLQQSDNLYPQRYMLWFVSFEADEIPYAKLLLAATHMPRHRDVSIQTFVATYGETFPAENASVSSLAQEVFGGHE